jgi:hypothetical protein
VLSVRDEMLYNCLLALACPSIAEYLLYSIFLTEGDTSRTDRPTAADNALYRRLPNGLSKDPIVPSKTTTFLVIPILRSELPTSGEL